ncbi:MAG: hypothetical protein RLZZ175_1406 [Bacteroidota bacterium]|jgi:hypothetical protein
MEPSDFLTILGLALAIWAIIPTKERQFILLFFSKFEISTFIASLFFIHYLMSFDWIKTNWFPSLAIFIFEYGISSLIWAYIVSLIVISYPIVKVTFGYFSRSRIVSLISVYKSYLKENEIDLLVNFIFKYHIEDIKIYLKGISHLPQKENIDIILRRRTDTDKAYEKLIKPKRILFASWVYGHIIQNETFVRGAANKYPELFATAFMGMETVEASNQDLVKLYIECLFEAKNQSFIQELRILNNANDSIIERNVFVDIPILFSLLSNTKVAVENYVWYPIGEGTVKSLKYDENQKDFLIKKYDSSLEPELWNQKVYIGIVYFNYMIRETIYRNSEFHMWLFYFRDFTSKIIEIIPLENDYDIKAEYPTFAHKILYEQISIMIDWLILAKELDNENRVIDTIRCLGGCIDNICNSENSKISFDYKKRVFTLIINQYFEFSKYPNNSAAKISRVWLEKLFCYPKNVDIGTQELTEKYVSIFRASWKDFDKFYYQDNYENFSISRFEENVIKKIMEYENNK